MLVRPALFWLLVAVLALSLLGNVVLAAAYSTTQFRATLAEQTSSRLSQERDEAQRQADNRQHELEDLRRQLAASPTPAAASTAAATATPAPTPAAAAAAATPSPEERATLVAIETKVEQIRGLAPLADVPLSFLDRDGLRQFLAQSFEKDYPPEEREADQRRYQALGLLKPSDDLTKQLLDLYSQQVIGLYDPDTKRMYLIGNHAPLSPDDEVTFAHEFTHALQDQHFDLNKIAPNHPDNLDRSLAVHGVIEGDAVLTMGLWAREALSKQEQQTLGQGSSSDTGLAQAPRILREDLLFPYTSGYQFVAQLHRSGGYQAVDGAFRDPPASTEQVLHPDKYAAHEPPVPVALPALAPSLGGAWKELASNVMGEFELRVLLRQFLAQDVAERAAAGWGGDRFSVLSDGPHTALALRTAWDTANDAQEFYDAYVQSLGVRFGPAAQTSDPDPAHHQVLAPECAVSVEHTGQEVLILIAPDAGTLQKLEGAFGA